MAELLDDFNDDQYLAKERHGCVSGCLWIMIVLSVFSVVVIIFAVDFMLAVFELGGQPIFSKSYLYVTSFFTAISVFAYFLILKWQKNGFYLMLGLSIASGLVGYYFLGDISSVPGSLIWPIIIFAVLQIPKNGVSAWDNLE